jgi:hypothetical protein
MLKDKLNFSVLLIFSLSCFSQTKASSDNGSDIDHWDDYSKKYQRKFYSKKNERKQSKKYSINSLSTNAETDDQNIKNNKYYFNQENFYLKINPIKIPKFKKDPFKSLYKSKVSLQLILCDGSTHKFDENGGNLFLEKLPKSQRNNSPWLAKIIVEPIHPFLNRYKSQNYFSEKIGFEPFESKHLINIKFNKEYENWFLITSK